MGKFKIGSSIWIDKQDSTFLGKGRIELLKLIDKTGSLSKAAKEMKMSYKAAWDSLNDMNGVSGVNLVESTSGGKGGGGSKLTPMAQLYIELYEKIYEEQRFFFDSIEPYMNDYEMLSFFLKRNALRVSARNQLKAKIESIDTNGLVVNIKLKIANIYLVSQITQKSANELSLKKNMDVYVIIKSSAIKILKSKETNRNNIVDVTIRDIENIGNIFEYTMKIDDNSILYTTHHDTNATYKRGDSVLISINPDDIMIGI